jgi:hypothetical protein
VQWVTLLSAVQELTSTQFQARVIAMLESIGSVMPGLGFVLGGAIATVLSPRASYAVAGAGVLVVVVVAAFALARAGWGGESSPPGVADAEPA